MNRLTGLLWSFRKLTGAGMVVNRSRKRGVGYFGDSVASEMESILPPPSPSWLLPPYRSQEEGGA